MAVPVFEYVARDAAGGVVRGTAQAQDARELATLLRRQGLFLTSLEAQRDGAGPVERVSLGLPELADFTHHMATLLGAGLTVSAALRAVEEHADAENLRRLARALRGEVEKGSRISAALAAVGVGMPPVFVGIVESGEATGRLDVAFGRLSGYLERELEFRRKVKEALAYPAVVLAAAALVVGVFMVYVIPAFERVYRSAGAPLPPITQALMATSRGVRVALPALAAVGALALLPRTRVGLVGWLRPALERAGDAAPRVGQLIRLARAARFLHSLGSSLTAGVPLLAALEVATRAAGRPHWLPALRKSVEEGSPLSETLRRIAEFPPLGARFVGLGEESGEVGEMALRAAEVLDRDFGLRVKRLLATLEPALTLGLAAVVGVILLALYMPIFGLGRAVLRH
ncbi:MAG: type II secretion system F family protein [Armatimonadota bacterium]|nr:type II secretion system F family protein [Armatimonadota bacterium]